MNLKIENQYFGPIASWCSLNRATNVDLCEYEYWRKSSFRNRCILPGANGLINLTIPVSGGREQKAIYRDILIDQKSKWQMHHWRSIFSVYGKSPWFLYYQEELEKLYQLKSKFLFDWNLECNSWAQKKLGLNLSFIRFDSGFPDSNEIITDEQDRIMPNNFQQSLIKPELRYAQVFEERIGFQTNMSILDLIFCEGKYASKFLEQ